ncbi:uncharacterized protein LOC143298611 [Babylonia areolata]|uniref:uncharacterized protein LOC143298611 n=1 Tax=Babylonia areolata TaxID=304850 RepID=UPI003FD4270D
MSQAHLIRKTKKSSYKPLSKLNEDNLSELKRVERPEYTSRVFFYNTTARSQLQNNVNVWFRHHQHAMSVINRQQRDVCKTMCRVQRDRHRVKRLVYQRRQQEIRANMKRMQVELLQRRVIQKFRRNADNKMAARGLKSLAGLRLTAQLRPDSVKHVTTAEDTAREEHAENTVAVPDNVVSHAAVVTESTASCEVGLSKGGAPGHHSHLQSRVSTHSNSGKGKAGSGQSPHQDHTLTKGRGSGRHMNSNSSGSSLSQQLAATSVQARSTTTKPSNRASTSAKLSETSRPSANKHSAPGSLATATPARGGKGSRRSCGGSAGEMTKGNLLERSGGFPQPADNRSVTQSQSPAFIEPADDSPLFMDPRVVEVRRSDPGSSAMVIQARRGANEGGPKATTCKTRPSRVEDLSVTAKLRHPDSSVPLHPSETPTPPTPSSSSTLRKEADPDPELSDLHLLTSTSSISQATSSGLLANGKDPTFSARGEGVSMRDVVSRDQAVEDAGLLLSLARERGREGGGQPVDAEGGGKKSLASRVKMERQEAAKRRAKILDDEPLTQYYRSTRGSLQPLLTQSWRRQFLLPSGRPKYWQGKLLRQEYQKGLERQQHIQDFITDLLTRRIGQPKPETTGANDEPQANHLELLLKRMRQQNRTQAPSVDWNCVEQLAKCQYLRIHHWHEEGEAEGQGEGEEEEEGEGHRWWSEEEWGGEGDHLTSWTVAEMRMKGGFPNSSF